jgi:trans-aconitate methyltransferase
MDPGFRGEIADFYHHYRRGYPPAVIDTVVNAFKLTSDDVVVDLGCGTGQLTLPIAGRVRAVAGLDPEPDMLARARRAAAELGIANVSWMIGADTDIPAIRALLGRQRAGAVTIGQALHWMRHDELFPALIPLVRTGGGVAVLTNGTPLWLQDSDWSQELRRFLEQWLDTTITATCGTDAVSQQNYRDSLAAAGYDVREASVEYSSDLDLEQLVGGIYSALPVGQLPTPNQRPRFAEQVRRALQPRERFTERVRVVMLLGRSSAGDPPA